jgi:hypothetical protein
MIAIQIMFVLFHSQTDVYENSSFKTSFQRFQQLLLNVEIVYQRAYAICFRALMVP